MSTRDTTIAWMVLIAVLYGVFLFGHAVGIKDCLQASREPRGEANVFPNTLAPKDGH